MDENVVTDTGHHGKVSVRHLPDGETEVMGDDAWRRLRRRLPDARSCGPPSASRRATPAELDRLRDDIAAIKAKIEEAKFAGGEVEHGEA